MYLGYIIVEGLSKEKIKDLYSTNNGIKDTIDVLGESLYKNNVVRRDKQVRKYVDENLDVKGNPSVLPGQLVMFDYFEPATKEDLEYYDAMPCTIFFGIANTKNGKRVIGFNIHYYPPRIRYLRYLNPSI